MISKSISGQSEGNHIGCLASKGIGAFFIQNESVEDSEIYNMLKANKNKIIAVDLTAQGFKNSSVLQFRGEMRIIKALTVDSDQKIINKIRSNDKDLYVWNLSKGNKYNVNTTAWTDLTSKNKKSLKRKNDDNSSTGPSVVGAIGIGGS